MSRLPALTGKRLVAVLQQLGFESLRVKGSHHFLRHPDGRTTMVPIHAGETWPWIDQQHPAPGEALSRRSAAITLRPHPHCLTPPLTAACAKAPAAPAQPRTGGPVDQQHGAAALTEAVAAAGAAAPGALANNVSVGTFAAECRAGVTARVHSHGPEAICIQIEESAASC